MTRDPDEIRGDFTRWSDAGIGIPTGAVNGFVVVEADTVSGRGMRQTENRRSTTTGQIRPIARHPASDQSRRVLFIGISNTRRRHQDQMLILGDWSGIDVKGDGGMVLAPPTAGQALGNTGGSTAIRSP